MRMRRARRDRGGTVPTQAHSGVGVCRGHDGASARRDSRGGGHDGCSHAPREGPMRLSRSGIALVVLVALGGCTAKRDDANANKSVAGNTAAVDAAMCSADAPSPAYTLTG